MTTDDPGHDAREEILALIWIYSDWHYVTRNLTTPERELWADAIDNVHRRDHAIDFVPVDRWWRT